MKIESQNRHVQSDKFPNVSADVKNTMFLTVLAVSTLLLAAIIRDDLVQVLPTTPSHVPMHPQIHQKGVPKLFDLDP